MAGELVRLPRQTFQTDTSAKILRFSFKDSQHVPNPPACMCLEKIEKGLETERVILDIILRSLWQILQLLTSYNISML